MAEALFDAASGWLREQGMDAIRGPENPSQNEEVGLLVDGFDEPPRGDDDVQPPLLPGPGRAGRLSKRPRTCTPGIF